MGLRTEREANVERQSADRIGLLAIPIAAGAFAYPAGQVVDHPLSMVGFGLLWGMIVAAVAPRLAQIGARSPAHASLPVLVMLPLGCVVLGGSIVAQIVGTTPEAFLLLLQQPTYGMFFYAIHALFEWVLIPWALIANWSYPARRWPLMAAAFIFYAARLASALYFAPNAIDWGNNPAEAAGMAAQVRLWVQLDLLRLVLQDGLIATIMLLLALHPRWQPQPQTMAHLHPRQHGSGP